MPRDGTVWAALSFSRTAGGAVRDALDAAIKAYLLTDGDRIAGVIFEPIVGNMGCVPPEPGYLALLRERTAEAGVILIFDEVMTGSRVALAAWSVSANNSSRQASRRCHST